MQGIFLSFYFLRILIFLSLQSKYAVAAVRGNYSNLDIFHCLPVPSASRESRLEGREAYICKSTGGACKGSTDKDAVEKKAGNGIPCDPEHPSQSIPIPPVQTQVLVKSEASQAPSLNQFLQSSNSEKVQTGGSFFSVCFPCLFLTQELKNELCNYRNAWDESDMTMKLATNGRQPGRLARNGNSRMRLKKRKM